MQPLLYRSPLWLHPCYQWVKRRGSSIDHKKWRSQRWQLPWVTVWLRKLCLHIYCKAFLVSVLLSLYRVSKIKGYAKSADSASSLHAFDFIFVFQLIIKFYTIICKNTSLKVCRHPAFGREVCTAPLRTSSMTTHKRRQWLQASFCALLHCYCLHGFSAGLLQHNEAKSQYFKGHL